MRLRAGDNFVAVLLQTQGNLHILSNFFFIIPADFAQNLCTENTHGPRGYENAVDFREDTLEKAECNQIFNFLYFFNKPVCVRCPHQTSNGSHSGSKVWNHFFESIILRERIRINRCYYFPLCNPYSLVECSC